MENYYMDLKYHLCDGTYYHLEGSVEGTVDFYIKDNEDVILSHQAILKDDIENLLGMFKKMNEYLEE